jgi:aspartate beta-hydroxylase
VENSDVTLQSLLAQARVLRDTQQSKPAAALYHQALKIQPLLPEALQYLLQQALIASDFAVALLWSERLVITYPTDIKLHNLIGELLKRLVEREDNIQVLQNLLQQCPNAYSSRLILARLQQQSGLNEQAIKNNLLAFKAANGCGFWLNDASTAPWARPFVMNAQHFVAKQKQELARLWLEPLWQNYGKEALQRVTKAVMMYSGEIPLQITDPRQKPSFLYFPDLPATPVFDREVLAFSEEYEASFSQIKQEMLNVLQAGEQFKPFTQHADEVLTEGGEWDAYFFHRHGVHFKEHHQQCPQTSAALAKLPLVHIAGNAPETCFSLMTPGAHILPHRGVTNSRAVLHLGLSIPEKCQLNLCDIIQLEWQEGKSFAFDDTYLHEAWNKSSETRVVLLTDIWNPYLTEIEQFAMKTIVEKMGLFTSKPDN